MGVKSIEELPDYAEVSNSLNIAAKNLELPAMPEA